MATPSFNKRVIGEVVNDTPSGLLVDVRNRGVLDIVGKPLHGPEKWKVHVYYNRLRPDF
jgi:hypothetical protein